METLFLCNELKHRTIQNMAPEICTRMPQAASEIWFWNQNWEKQSNYSKAELTSQLIGHFNGCLPRNLSMHTSAHTDVSSYTDECGGAGSKERRSRAGWPGQLICHFRNIALFARNASRCFSVFCEAILNVCNELTMRIEKLQVTPQRYTYYTFKINWAVWNIVAAGA